MNKSTIDKIFSILLKLTPNPKTELNYSNNFTLLVAVVLSAQATDISVNKATKELFTIIKTPQDIINLGEEKLKTYIKTIGLYNAKAKNIIELSKQLIQHHNNTVPNTLEQLVKLPGVGRKTANVILNVAFNKPTIAVDTHVFRVSNRIGLSNATTPLNTELQLLKNVPQKYIFLAHHLLILHGRYICKAKNPLCNKCPIKTYCKFYNLNNH
ncbi:UNVERIFIED_CONTAM: hypothetical protein PYX00_011140 [Menopon gallinae]|uniref:DNA-(apurinic or apyrimidinic site) lyase n=1 Tax=Menopon gallinae TaxID=328185 RepID=A0AAW2H6A9_9NEOP